MSIQDCSSRDKSQGGPGWSDGDTAYTLDTTGLQGVATFDPTNVTSWANRSRIDPALPCHTLHHAPPALIGRGVRRLTPVECERLQGLPDDYTAVPHRGKPMADGQRYKMVGNSMAVPCMRWIGERIARVESIVVSNHPVPSDDTVDTVDITHSSHSSHSRLAREPSTFRR